MTLLLGVGEEDEFRSAVDGAPTEVVHARQDVVARLKATRASRAHTTLDRYTDTKGKDHRRRELASQSRIPTPLPFFPKLQAKSGFEMCFDIGSRHLGCWGQNTSPEAQGCDLS